MKDVAVTYKYQIQSRPMFHKSKSDELWANMGEPHEMEPQAKSTIRQTRLFQLDVLMEYRIVPVPV